MGKKAMRKKAMRKSTMKGTMIFCAWTLAVLALSSTGCSTTAPLNAPEVVHNFQPSDLPVPLGFELDEKRSWAYIKFMDGPLELRSCQLVYWGKRPANEVASWYRDQMEKHGWKHQRTDGTKGIRLFFTKGSEESEIFLKRVVDKNREFFVTRLSARIGVL